MSINVSEIKPYRIKFVIQILKKLNFYIKDFLIFSKFCYTVYFYCLSLIVLNDLILLYKWCYFHFTVTKIWWVKTRPDLTSKWRIGFSDITTQTVSFISLTDWISNYFVLLPMHKTIQHVCVSNLPHFGNHVNTQI